MSAILPSNANKSPLNPTRYENFNQVPKELIRLIFSYLETHELKNCCFLNKRWGAIANERVMSNYLASFPFGKEKWATYIGDIGEEPALPSNIFQILRSPCPFWNGKRVFETHMLVLIPATINGKSLTLNLLQNLVQSPLQGNKSRYQLYGSSIKRQYGNNSIKESCWTLMLKEVIPNSRGKTLLEHNQMIKCYQDYTFPKVLEATICLFMQFIAYGIYLYDETFMRCEEKMKGRFPISVGNFGPKGLFVFNRISLADKDYGAGAIRRF